MSKMKACKDCGQEISKSAKTCPHCGAKQKGSPVGAIVVVIIIIAIIAAVGGFSSNTPKKVDTTSAPPTEEPKQTVFYKGDTVELNDVHVTLLDVAESVGNQLFTPTDGNEFVTFEIEIENNSKEEIGISSILMFTAYFDDYAANLDVSAIVETGKTQLDGTIAPGKKMRGVVGYEAPKDWKVTEIRVKPDFWKGGEITFQYSK